MQILRHKEGKSNGAGKKRKNIRKKKDKKSKKNKYRVVTKDLADPEIELYLPLMGENQASSQKAIL